MKQEFNIRIEVGEQGNFLVARFKRDGEYFTIATIGKELRKTQQDFDTWIELVNKTFLATVDVICKSHGATFIAGPISTTKIHEMN